jgi:hypothetical protein
MKTSGIHALALTSALLVAPLQSNAAIIGFDIPDATPTFGSDFVINAIISDLGDGVSPSISVFDLVLSFDETVLSIDTTDADVDNVIDSVTLDPDGNLDVLGLGGNILEAYLGAPGALTLLDSSLDDPQDLIDFQAGSFILATMTFQASALGTSALSWTVNDLGDENGDLLSATLNTGSVTVISGSTAPIPSSLLLLAAGLLGLRAARGVRNV